MMTICMSPVIVYTTHMLSTDCIYRSSATRQLHGDRTVLLFFFSSVGNNASLQHVRRVCVKASCLHAALGAVTERGPRARSGDTSSHCTRARREHALTCRRATRAPALVTLSLPPAQTRGKSSPTVRRLARTVYSSYVCFT